MFRDVREPCRVTARELYGLPTGADMIFRKHADRESNAGSIFKRSASGGRGPSVRGSVSGTTERKTTRAGPDIWDAVTSLLDENKVMKWATIELVPHRNSLADILERWNALGSRARQTPAVFYICIGSDHR